jgi:hypothetical protein
LFRDAIRSCLVRYDPPGACGNQRPLKRRRSTRPRRRHAGGCGCSC